MQAIISMQNKQITFKNIFLENGILCFVQMVLDDDLKGIRRHEMCFGKSIAAGFMVPCRRAASNFPKIVKI